MSDNIQTNTTVTESNTFRKIYVRTGKGLCVKMKKINLKGAAYGQEYNSGSR